MIDKFTEFGRTFQIKLIAALMADKPFLQQILDILAPEFFDSEANQWIVRIIHEYYAQYNSIPSLEVYKVKALELTNESLKVEIVENLKDIIKIIENPKDLEFVKNESLAFCKNQCIKNAIIESVDLLKTGHYDQIKEKIDIALKSGGDRNIGMQYLDNIRSRYENNIRKTIELPWTVVNDLIDSGLGIGEMMVLVAGPGAGKSTSMMNIAAHALKQGKTVIHYTLELSEEYTATRYDGIMTGIATANLKYNIEDVEAELGKVKGNLILKYYPSGTASVLTLKSHLDKCILQGVTPDLIIVDYADLLKGTGKRQQELHQELNTIYTDLRGMAGEYGTRLVTASQANRSAEESDVITGGQVSSSYSKIMIGDLIISLSRKTTDKIAGTGRWHFIKNRFGPDGITLPSKLNMSNGRIEIYEESSIKGKETRNEMDSDSVLKKSLHLKYKEMLG